MVWPGGPRLPGWSCSVGPGRTRAASEGPWGGGQGGRVVWVAEGASARAAVGDPLAEGRYAPEG